jgi:hypothetical protein
MFLRYEDLVASTGPVMERLSRFIDRPCRALDLAEFGKNSSHGGSRKSLAVSGAEVWLAERVIGGELRSLGFSPSQDASPTVGLFELAGILTRSSLFIGGQVLSDPDRRKRALNFLRG